MISKNSSIREPEFVKTSTRMNKSELLDEVQKLRAEVVLLRGLDKDDVLISREEHEKLVTAAGELDTLKDLLRDIKAVKERLDSGVADSGELEQLNDELENFL